MQQENEPSRRDQTQSKMGQINVALGLFICFFGATVLISMFFTETFVGKMTNLAAGAILVAIGVVMIVRAKPDSAG
jgi:hypothetical protein